MIPFIEETFEKIEGLIARAHLSLLTYGPYLPSKLDFFIWTQTRGKAGQVLGKRSLGTFWKTNVTLVLEIFSIIEFKQSHSCHQTKNRAKIAHLASRVFSFRFFSIVRMPGRLL